MISLDHVDAPNDMLVWPAFHNGVAAGLRIIPGISQVEYIRSSCRENSLELIELSSINKVSLV